ncbi:hypothetical protein [Paenibacillus sp. FSL H7-0714]|uniref:hypothetical protein n=1 Tax=Paenibacillus sp. FSL H7-0714 TaxID=2954735 RepID=UPI0030F8DC5C
MSSNGRITDEAGYQKSLGWLVEKAVILEDPLIDPEEKAKLQRTYDFVEQRLLEYRRGELVQLFPGLWDIYKILGWAVQEHEPITSESETDTTPIETPVISTPPEPKTPPVKAIASQNEKPKTVVNLSAWLDD